MTVHAEAPPPWQTLGPPVSNASPSEVKCSCEGRGEGYQGEGNQGLEGQLIKIRH